MEAIGWSCPNCGKAHSPAVETCPEPPKGWRIDVPADTLKGVCPYPPYAPNWTPITAAPGGPPLKGFSVLTIGHGLATQAQGGWLWS